MAAQTKIELMQYRCSAKFEHAIDAGPIFVCYLLPRYKSKHTKIEQKRLPEKCHFRFFQCFRSRSCHAHKTTPLHV